MPIETRSFGTEEELEKIVAHAKAVYEELYAKYGKSEKREEYYLWQNANLRHLGSEKQLMFTIISHFSVIYTFHGNKKRSGINRSVFF
jgi:hypothetical protein